MDKNEKSTVLLKVAKADDLKQIKRYKTIGTGNHTPVFEPKFGQIFKVKSMITGEFDNKFYVISESTDPNDLAELLKFKMIYIPIEIIPDKVDIGKFLESK